MADILNLDKTPLYTTPAGTTYLVPGPGLQAIEQLINASWSEARDNKAEFSAKLAAALDDFLANAASPHVSTGAVDAPVIVEPAVDIPATQSVGDVISTFDTKYLELVSMLVDKFTRFRADYFPNEDSTYSAVEAWLQAAIADPSGLPMSVVTQIFGDDQARILAEKTRAQDSVVAQFAGRRFPLPPDVSASMVMQIEQKAQDELAESSRKVAALSVEMQKFNVEKLLGLRGMAMDSAIKYISALASGPEMASKLVGVGYDAQSKLISSAATFLNARTQAAETVAKVAQYNNSVQLEADAKNQAADMQMVENKLKALLADCEAMSRIIASLYNNLHVGSTMSTQLAGSIVQ